MAVVLGDTERRGLFGQSVRLLRLSMQISIVVLLHVRAEAGDMDKGLSLWVDIV